MCVVQSWTRQQLQKRQNRQMSLTSLMLMPWHQHRQQMLMLSPQTSRQSWRSSQSSHSPAPLMQVACTLDSASGAVTQTL